ncbi:hypothetical protein [Roseivivax sediminis]|uniref:hypothetical protein n=1 Tax=Roseivivax sediminis TaxID=936889 RepID=UPI00122C2A53|nr:hypothetical protein [Roseivivax sediminis]
MPALLAGAAAADVSDNPAARCAALWQGYAQYAEISTYLSGAEEARTEAARFRDVAVRETGDPAAVEEWIAREAPRRARMVEAYVYASDRQSQEVFERAMSACR